jgi:predicted TIM-barrel fold metal-dependent hydrolase
MEHFYYDTAMTDTESLMLTYLRVGDRLMLGTDHPFTDNGIQRTINAIEAMDISNESKAKILGENAVALLRK